MARAAFLRALSGAAEDAQRLRFRRPAAAHAGDPEDPSRRARAVSASASNISSSTNIRTPTPASICGCGCSRRRARISVSSATTTSRCISWRGAEVANILRFDKDFPGATIIRLEQNYRSTPRVLAAASALIAHNSGRLGKTLWTELDPGDKLRVVGVWDGLPRGGDAGSARSLRRSSTAR